jgi:hypothetical protein
MQFFTETDKELHQSAGFFVTLFSLFLQVGEVLRIEQLKTDVLHLPDIYLERQVIQEAYDSFQFLEHNNIFYAFEEKQSKSLDFFSDYHFQGGGIN